MTKICFVDTETTSLRPDRRAWDIAVIVREPGEADAEHQWFVDDDDLDLGNADPHSLRIGGFHDRHPQQGGAFDAWAGACRTRSEYAVLREVERVTRGAHLVGAVPDFDAEVLGARMRANGLCPSWHYHLIDVETLAVGYLCVQRGTRPADLPWRSDDLSRAVGVEPPSEQDRHTALGDARWVRALYDAITGGGR